MLNVNLARLAGVLALVAVVVSIPAAPVQASHNTYWFHVKAPFSGYWDRHGLSSPSGDTPHPPGLIAGDWATDYYKEQGTRGRWYASASDGGSVSAYIYYPWNACNESSWTFAGRSYRIDLKRSGVKHGHFGYVHVDPRNPSTGSVLTYSNGSFLSNGCTIGWTYKYDSSYCYVVGDDAGTHWHILGYNEPPGHHYSCWYGWSTAAWLTQGTSVLGVVYSNATGSGQSCF